MDRIWKRLYCKSRDLLLSRRRRSLRRAGVSTEYIGNLIYEFGSLKRILTDNGYYEDGNYYFYLKNHLGSNVTAVKKDGAIVQQTHYYPYGLPMGISDNPGVQDYKFIGKELDMQHGLMMYDLSARQYDPTIGRFLTPDPPAEKYYSISPYAYCADNPVNNVDLNGDSISVNQTVANDFVLNKAFELFANSKEGRNFLVNYASKGQVIAGNTYTKDGKYHKEGINLAYTTFESSDPGNKGKTVFSDNGTITVAVNSLQKVDMEEEGIYNWSSYFTSMQTANQMTYGVLSRNMTFFHESFIHADLFTSDYLDDKKFNYSNIPSNIKQYADNRFSFSPTTQYHHMYVRNGLSGSSLWPISAYRGIIEVNSKFGRKYTNSELKTMMWNYNGGK